nr:stigma-specific STIG1-like protein 1 [Ipomoea batatas]
MDSPKFIAISTFLLALTILLLQASPSNQESLPDAYNPPRRGEYTCDKYPRVCRGSRPDCCKKQCVNVMSDRLNCGKCGKKCKFSEICCHGDCVNPNVDRRHCGKCNNRCKKGDSCVYGICSYA